MVTLDIVEGMFHQVPRVNNQHSYLVSHLKAPQHSRKQLCRSMQSSPPVTPSCPDVQGQLERHPPDTATEGLPLGAGTSLTILLILH